MRTITAALTTLSLLGGCMQSNTLAESFSPTAEPLGYPVFVGARGKACTYQVQDMIFLRGRDLEDWMGNLSDKTWQIDLVFKDSRERCLSTALGFVKSAGFTNILLRRGEGLDYGGGLPPP